MLANVFVFVRNLFIFKSSLPACSLCICVCVCVCASISASVCACCDKNKSPQ